MGFIIKYEDDRMVRIMDEDKNLFYQILKEDNNILSCITNHNDNPIDVVIPHELLPGFKIDRIRRVDSTYGYNHFKKIIISEGIEIEDGAFCFCRADEVVWPGDQLIIPKGCFMGSSIKRLSNTDRVNEIKSKAFAVSHIKEFSWPTNCKIIPFACFRSSYLEKISNIQNVKLIEREAFALSRLKELDLSDAAAICFDAGSLLNLPGYCDFTPPYYSEKEEIENAHNFYTTR